MTVVTPLFLTGRLPSAVLTGAGDFARMTPAHEARVNSSKTWKSGERCRFGGVYRCQTCHLEGRETLRECAVGTIMPMCDVCPEKDTTWRLIRPAGAAVAGS